MDIMDEEKDENKFSHMLIIKLLQIDFKNDGRNANIRSMLKKNQSFHFHPMLISPPNHSKTSYRASKL